MNEVKGLTVSIYRDADGSNCTNGGMSSKFKTAVLVHPKIDGIFAPRPDSPVLRLVYREKLNYWHAEPIDQEGKWLMFGGNFCYTSDSRVRALCPYPIPIHDRVEN